MPQILRSLPFRRPIIHGRDFIIFRSQNIAVDNKNTKGLCLHFDWVFIHPNLSVPVIIRTLIRVIISV